ncbi:MAG: GNAT family N-acetyltransferase [Clostridiales bacterium]|nr:GNAT family N-acetyltransferase [Clostridiales bacterium]
MPDHRAAPWFKRLLKPGVRQKDSLITPRLLLRPLRTQDARDFHAYARDPLVARFVFWEAHTSLTQTRAILQSMILESHLTGLHTMALVLRDSQRMVGTIGLVERLGADRAELGFSLARDCWGQGLMTEALTTYLEHLFTRHDFTQLLAKHDTLNPASGAVMRKAGMTQLRQAPERLRYKGREAQLATYRADREGWLAWWAGCRRPLP